MQLKGFLRKKLVKVKPPPYPSISLEEPKVLVPLPTFKDATKTDVRYPLLQPFSYAHITWNAEEKKLMYEVEEPVLSEGEKNDLKKISKTLTELIDVKITAMKREKAIEYLQKKIKVVMEELNFVIPQESYIRIMYYIIRDFVGMNEIEPILHDPYLEDMGVSGLNIPVFIVHRKYGPMETNIVFNDIDYLNDFVIKIAEKCGRYISYASPLLGGTLPDGSRIQASLAKDVTTKGPTFSIRKFRRNPYSPADILNMHSTSPDMLAYLWFLVEHTKSILICGGVSTGKTTFLNTLCMFIPPENKIVSIEDVREINIPHINWIPATSRLGFGVPEAGGKRYGEVTLFDLLKESFRMKPDYTIVGEVRGTEAYVMFQGMASGNPSLGTIHAGSVEDVIKRLETPPIELSPALIEALDVLIVMVVAKEKGKSARRVKEVVEIQSMDINTGKALTIKTFTWLPGVDKFKDNTENSQLLRRLSFETGIPHNKIMEELADRSKVIKWTQTHNVVQYDEFCKIINMYYKEKETLMEWVNKNIPPYKTKAKEIMSELWESATGLRVWK